MKRPLSGDKRKDYYQIVVLISMTEHLGGKTESTKNKSDYCCKAPSTDKDSKALAAYHSKLEPHLLPIFYAEDPELLSQYVHCASNFCSELEAALSVVPLFTLIKGKKKAVLEIFADSNQHFLAEHQLCTLTVKIFSLAVSHETK